MLPVCCGQGAVQGSVRVLHILAPGAFQLLSKHKYLPYHKRKFLFPSRKSLWGGAGRSGRWLHSQPLGRSNGEPNVGRREQGTSTFGVVFLLSSSVYISYREKHVLQEEAQQNYNLLGYLDTRCENKAGSRNSTSCIRKGMGGRTAVTCCANHEL